MYAADGGHTGCVQALVAAKAALDIQSVSYARLFACPVTIESPKHIQATYAPAGCFVCCCVCLCVYEQ